MFDESETHRQISTRRLISLLQSTTLRRTKELLHLPDITDITRTVELSESERKQYNAAKEAMNRKLRIRVDETGALSKFGMFQIQLQLRILCNHGTWQHQFHWARANRLDEQEDALSSTNYAGEVRCSACLQLVPLIDSNSVHRRYQLNCSHILCSDCLDDNDLGLMDSTIKRQCPQCLASGDFTQRGDKDGISDTYFHPHGYSAKMEVLISDLSYDIDKSKK
jgi:SWI/SNF-related matrix-associated actin-dependent regulator of chromatin subfamily A3